MTAEILRLLGPSCRDATRRELLVATSLPINGIDFVEYRQNSTDPVHVLELHFLRPSVPTGLRAADFVIAGGTRIVDIQPTGDPTTVTDLEVLELPVSAQGDFSTYTLSVAWSRQSDGTWQFDDTKGIDRLFSVAPINFRAACPVDFDCAPRDVCQEEAPLEPALDYLAKDYASFRQLLVDLVAQRNPRWFERNPADIGIALLELFAHEGDHLSYFQDAVANEAYLDTARQRISAKRHAKLVDYAMHDGRNAWTFVHVAVSAGGTLPLGRKLLTRITTPLQHQDAAPGVVIPDPDPEAFDRDPALTRTNVFETATTLSARVHNNLIRLHTWGNDQCCLGRGTVTAHLYAVDALGHALRPPLELGDYLLLEELLGPETGEAADANPAHRAVVQIVEKRSLTDPVFQVALVSGELVPRTDPATQFALPLLEVTWRLADALTFPLCLAASRTDGSVIRRISVARGNIVLADHGRTTSDDFTIDEPVGPEVPFRLRLSRPQLTMECQPEEVDYDADAVMTSERPDLAGDVRAAKAAVALRVTHVSGALQLWTLVPDLLDSSPFDQHFVADIGDDGMPTLRFGDGEYGHALSGATAVHAVYRIGNGRSGNVGAEALAHIIRPTVATGWPVITAIRNPLPARDGTDPETIEQVRQYAPAAFRAQQFRAVTEADYQNAALGLDGVAGAVAAFRWTGSWYTVFVGIDPLRSTDVLTAPGGRTRLAPEFEQQVRSGLTRYRLAGYDLEMRTALYVSLKLEIELCVASDHFRSDVTEAVVIALGAYFNPDNWTFGQAVYLSGIYAAVKAVEGVASLDVKAFHRFGRDPAGELEAGVIPIGPWEIARLDNDPNRMENGTLIVTAGGGK